MSRPGHEIRVYVTPKEFAAFEKAFAASSSQTRSSYAKKLLFGKAIRIYYRDRAFDAFIDTGVQFNKDVHLLLSDGGFDGESRKHLVTLAEDIKTLLIKIDNYVRETKGNRLPPRND